MQWYDNLTHTVGVYEPDYLDKSGRGKLIQWTPERIHWQTPDKTIPMDHSKECSILSDFATAINVECEHAIMIVFIFGFLITFVLLLSVIIIFKRRYDKNILCNRFMFFCCSLK